MSMQTFEKEEANAVKGKLTLLLAYYLGKWLFCQQWHFSLGDYFAVIIHVWSYCHNCCTFASDAVVHG